MKIQKANSGWLKKLIILVGFSILPLISHAGSLEPPGPPSAGGTMKTLDEVELRKPISQSDIPLTITEGGSYYLSGNLTSTETLVTVDANDVTIDLMGYSLDDQSVGNKAISIEAGIKNTTIRNGYIHNWLDAGIYAEEAEQTFVENIHMYTIPGEGFFLANASTAINCSATNCSNGFVAGEASTLTRCTCA